MLEHLALVESKHNKPQAAIEVMQEETTIRSFILIKPINSISKVKGKLHQMVLAEKVQPNYEFTVNELIKLVNKTPSFNRNIPFLFVEH